MKKIADIPKGCRHPKHSPPSHIVLKPGVYEHTCPKCKANVVFSVPTKEL